jgi:hypothetical protein
MPIGSQGPAVDTRRFAQDPKAAEAQGLLEQLAQSVLMAPERQAQFMDIIPPETKMQVMQNLGLGDTVAQMQAEQARVDEFGGIRAPRLTDPDQFGAAAPMMMGVIDPVQGAKWSAKALRAFEKDPDRVRKTLNLTHASGKPAQPRDYVRQLLSNPNFMEHDPITRGEIVAQVERLPRAGKYAEESAVPTVKQGSAKTGGSQIRAADTVRGCGNKCLNCYALGGANQQCVDHTVEVLNDLEGKLNPGEVLRIGEVGDPASNWQWSNHQMQKLYGRSPGMAYDDSLFAITKLQSIEGYDPTIWRNLEVSIDPLNPVHMKKTMENIDKIRKMDPTVNIVARIRTLASKDPMIKQNLNDAVQFAQSRKLPVLETRIRFKNKMMRDVLNLDETMYAQVGPQYKLKEPMLENLEGVESMMCGTGSTGKCVTCQNCEKVFSFNEFAETAKQMKAQGGWR